MLRRLNLEFLFPITDYFKTTDWYDRNWDITLPFVTSLLLFLFVFNSLDIIDKNLVLIPSIKIYTIKDILSSFMQSTAVIFSFSMASVTIFVTSSSKNIEEIKNLKWANSNEYNLYQRVLAGYTYALIVSSFATLFNLLLYLFAAPERFSGQNMVILLIMSTFLLIHILFVSIRNITGLYHILWKTNKQEKV